MTSSQTVKVPPDMDRVRSDRVIATMLDMSRGEVRRIIEGGGATVHGRAVRASETFPAGTPIVVEVPDPVPEVVPTPVAFAVVHEDGDLVVVDKPAGVVVHPGAGTSEPTLVAGLVHRFPELRELSDQRYGLVHRLDRDTSGLLVVGRTAAAHATLQDALRRREVTRTYLALVAGRPEAATGTIDAPIGRDPQNPTRQALLHDGRAARTHYRRRAVWSEVSLLEVTLETGRTHQIRVHFASIGHPVVGDTVYGGRGRQPGDPSRQWLHAWKLSFGHPHTGELSSHVAPLPKDLRGSLGELGDPLLGSVDGVV